MVRYKHRYFAVEINPTDRPSHAPFSLTPSKIYTCLLRHIQQVHGDFGVGAIMNGFTTKYCNPYTKVALIRARHGPHRFIATVLPLIKSINKVEVSVKTLYVGATIVQCYKYVRNYQLHQLEKYWNRMKSDEDRKLLKESILDISSIMEERNLPQK